ncbi:TIGR03862 family flavoprotein [Nereida sp.]|uniref:TIGR03862 family flavoprotein n=1 Tax=Nereida sp. TaxID=2736090 RepID=UPI003F6A4178
MSHCTTETAVDALLVGAGPAGLMAADVLGKAGYSVLLAEHKPSVARKFLMAGKSGLNLTKDEPLDEMLAAFGPSADRLAPILRDFDARAVQAWAQSLGQPLFTGSSKRVFPKTMKASPLLRAWLAEINARVETRWRWKGFDGAFSVFETPDGPQNVNAKVTILAMGGASWRKLGSDGSWAEVLSDEDIVPFQPMNMGFRVNWSSHVEAHFGAPIKAVALHAGGQVERAEFTISKAGIEGGGIYLVSKAMRDGAPLTVDLFPDLSVNVLRQKLGGRGKVSVTSHLRKRLKLTGARLALLQEFGRPLPNDLAPLLKAVPIRHDGPRDLDEAISTSGGVSWAALDSNLMLRARANTFCAGEMIDWDAPTGGYLLTGCLATGRWAGRAAVEALAAV